MTEMFRPASSDPGQDKSEPSASFGIGAADGELIPGPAARPVLSG